MQASTVTDISTGKQQISAQKVIVLETGKYTVRDIQGSVAHSISGTQ